MLFPSLVFLFVFLPLLLVVYYLTPARFRNHILLLFSLVFYAWGGVSYSAILIASIIINYLVAKRIEKSNTKKNWLWAGLVFNVLLIVGFKYFNFFIQNINELGSLIGSAEKVLPELKIILPLGISFFTFQQMSLLWDVSRGQNEHSPTFLNTALYVSFFPQLVAGPIVRYNEIIAQIKTRTETTSLFTSGILKFILGLFKKVVIANTCGSLADTIFVLDQSALCSSVAWLGIIAYSFQIYFDFAGYSDMAIGLSRMFGFRIAENFNFPYISHSIQEFWKRWHISLSSWFKDYVYIPLGGNRRNATRTYINLLIVFLLAGFWHGATWSFIFWGMFHGIFLIIERLGWDKVLAKLPYPVSSLYTLVVVMIGWVFFRIENFGEAAEYVMTLFSFGKSSDYHIIDFLNRENIPILFLAMLSSTTLFAKLVNCARQIDSPNLKFTLVIMRNVGALAMFLFTIMLINSSTYNPFIYFRF